MSVQMKKDFLELTAKRCDLLCVVVAFALASVAAFTETGDPSLHEFLRMRIEVFNLLVFLSMMLVWQWLFMAVGLYHASAAGPRAPEIRRVFLATLLATLTAAAFGYAFEIEIISVLFLAVFWSSSFFLTLAARLLQRALVQRLSAGGKGIRHVVIAGTNPRAIQMARRIERGMGANYRLLGFVDNGWYVSGDQVPEDHSIVSDFDGFENYLKDHVVDEVIVCMPLKSLYEESSLILTTCGEQGIVVRFALDLFDSQSGCSQVEHFGGDYLMTLNAAAIDGVGQMFKRCLDFLAASVLLLALAPLMLLIAGLIALSSPGPMLFVQQRLGLNKRLFKLYKFRTMVVGAESRMPELEHMNEVSGPVFKIRNDPRITSIGRFLRKTSLDELPQLFNVIKGEMSLVGPRPLPVRDYQGFSENWQRRRFSVRPGITCLWQVEGRNQIAFEEWMRLDMRYIDNWSPWLDLKILLRTIPAVLRGSGV